MTLPAYVGRYEVRKEIAKGGFAVVVQAWDEELESFVAIKILHPELMHEGEIQRKFLEEARLLRRIRCSNVVAVHDVGRLNDGRPYFVMEFAEGGTLARRLKRKADSAAGPDAQSIALLIDAIANGVSAIHDAGVVHRDIKPANILFQRWRRSASEPDAEAAHDALAPATLATPQERILVGDLGIAKDLLKRGALASLVGGTPLYQAPEQAEGDTEITQAVDVYASTALLWQVLTGHKPPASGSIAERVAILPPVWQELIACGMALDPGARFASIESWRSAVHDALARDAALVQDGMPTQVGPSAVADCPYKGLGAYQPEDAGRFFGRDKLTEELVRRLQLQRVLVVGGPSGSGKSSLVRAGLIPAVRAGALVRSDAWPVVLMTPGRDPMAELHFQMTRAASPGASRVSVDDLLSRPALARHLGPGNGSPQPLLLCIDQFEELFTLAPPTQSNKFVEALSAMTDPVDSQVRLIIVVRADFYGACAHVPWLAERITDNQVLVGPMSETELRQAISEPARRAGFYLERSLIDAVIAEAGTEPGSLPLVAHALVETWVRRQGSTLTLEGFRAAGGVAGAISQTADATFEHRFNAVEQQATRRLLLRLVRPGEGTPDTRRAVARSEIARDSQAEVMQRVVDCLTQARLLSVDEATVQIPHEALLHTWPRLRDWIEEFRDDLRMRQRISRAAAEWDDAERDSDLLYRGTLLLSALEWMAKNRDDLGEVEREFVDASAEAAAKAKAVAAERERRMRRLRRLAVGFLSFLAVGATVTSITAVVAFRQAQHNEGRAELATAQARTRFAGALGAVAHGLVDSDPLLALSLAGEAIMRSQSEPPSYEARAALVAARRVVARGEPFVVGSPVRAGDARAVAISPDGALLAAGRRDGTVEIMDIRTRQPLASLHGHKGGVEDVKFAPDGKWLTSGGDDGTVRIWPLGGQTRGAERTIGIVHTVVWKVCINQDGSMIASTGEDGTVRLWDVATGTQLGQPLLGRQAEFLGVSFSPDGRAVLAGTGAGEVYGWMLPSGDKLLERVRGAHTSDIWDLAFNARGDRFATTSSDGTSVVFDFPSGRIVSRAFEGVGRITGVRFTPDDNVLVGGAADGGLRMWDVERRKLLVSTPSAHDGAIVNTAASRDGTLMATLGEDQLIRFWRLRTSYPVASVHQVAAGAAKGLAFSRDGRRLAAGDDSGIVQVWTLGTDNAQLLRGHRHSVWAVAFSPDGSLLASGDRAGKVRLWDVATGALRSTIAVDDGAIHSLAFLGADGTQLMTASEARVRFWEVATGVSRRELPHTRGQITRAVLAPNGASLAVASSDGRVRVWDVDKAALIKDFAADDDTIWSLAFSPDGRRLATASSDEIITVWDVNTWEQRAVLTGHTGGATDLTYLADGVTLVSVDRSGKVHLWDAETSRQLAEATQSHSRASWQIVVHPDGRRFATAGDDGQVKVWDELSVARVCDIAGPAFDAARRQQYLGEGERSVACEAAH
jgi:WD40 repeat protein